jgi:membrane-bound lytic murein transglycosylase MltF
MLFLYRYAEYHPRDYDEIRAEGILRLVTEYNQTGYFVSGDTLAGFQYELSRAISEITDLEVQITLETSLAESFKGLRKRKYDIIARNISITSAIKEEYLFTDPIVFDKQVLVQRKAGANDSIPPVRNQLELAKKTIYIPAYSPAILRLKHLQHEIGDTLFIVEADDLSSEQLILLITQKVIDYAVCDLQTAIAAKNQFLDIDIETDISFTQLQSWAVRKESVTLLDSLNSWFQQLRNTNLFNDIYKRYYD